MTTAQPQNADRVFEIMDEANVTPALDREIRAFLCVCFAGDTPSWPSRYWHTSTPAYSVICRDVTGGALLAHIGIVVRRIRCGGTQITIAGVQNLGVKPGTRGGRLGYRVTEMAMDEARRRKIDFGLLFCIPALEAYYQGNGWQTTTEPVTMKYLADDEPIPGKNIGMFRLLGTQPFPAGPIHLQGPDW
jgi:hypothetical protein